MTTEEAIALKVGDRVTWDGDDADVGTVTETGYLALKIEWDNAQEGSLHVNDCERVGKPEVGA